MENTIVGREFVDISTTFLSSLHPSQNGLTPFQIARANGKEAFCDILENQYNVKEKQITEVRLIDLVCVWVSMCEFVFVCRCVYIYVCVCVCVCVCAHSIV